MSCTSCEYGPKRCPAVIDRGERNAKDIRLRTLAELLALERRLGEFPQELIPKRRRHDVLEALRFGGLDGVVEGRRLSRPREALAGEIVFALVL